MDVVNGIAVWYTVAGVDVVKGTAVWFGSCGSEMCAFTK